MDAPTLATQILNYRRGTISPAGKEVLETWALESPANRAFMDMDMEEEAMIWHLEVLLGLKDEKIEERRQQLLARLEPAETIPVKQQGRKLWLQVAIAAVFIGVAFFAWRLIISKGLSGALAIKPQPATVTDGKGQTINLDSLSEEGRSVRVGSLTVLKTDKTHISCLWAEQPENIKKETDSPSIFIPPNTDSSGWQVSLPDGSKAIVLSGILSISHVNTDDSTAPRKVRLDGYAMFEVNKDANRPFVVETPRATTKALGTFFSVNASSHASSDTISLFDGRLEVNKGTIKQTIEAGQQALINNTSDEIMVRPIVNRRDKIPWKRDAFDFSRDNLRVAMERIKNWYHLKDVKFGQGLDMVTPGILSDGLIDKKQSLSQLLNLLNKIKVHEMHFFIKDYIIYVNRK